MTFDLFDKITHPLYALGVLSILIDLVLLVLWVLLILRYYPGDHYDLPL